MRFTIDVQDSVKDKFLWLLDHFNAEVQVYSPVTSNETMEQQMKVISVEEFEKEFLR